MINVIRPVSTAQRNKEMKTRVTTTTTVKLVTSSRLGHVTLRNSSLDSRMNCKICFTLIPVPEQSGLGLFMNGMLIAEFTIFLYLKLSSLVLLVLGR